MSRDVTFYEETGNNTTSFQDDTPSRGGDKQEQLDSVDKRVTFEDENRNDDENANEADLITTDSEPGQHDDSNEDSEEEEDNESEEADSTIPESTTVQPEPTTLRRSARESRKPPDWWRGSANIALSARVVPLSYKAATTPSNVDFWTPGIAKAHDCLLRNKTWSLVKREPGMHVEQIRLKQSCSNLINRVYSKCTVG